MESLCHATYNCAFSANVSLLVIERINERTKNSGFVLNFPAVSQFLGLTESLAYSSTHFGRLINNMLYLS